MRALELPQARGHQYMYIVHPHLNHSFKMFQMRKVVFFHIWCTICNILIIHSTMYRNYIYILITYDRFMKYVYIYIWYMIWYDICIYIYMSILFYIDPLLKMYLLCFFFFPNLQVLEIYPDATQRFFHASATLALPLVDDSDNTVRQEAAPWRFAMGFGWENHGGNCRNPRSWGKHRKTMEKTWSYDF